MRSTSYLSVTKDKESLEIIKKHLETMLPEISHNPEDENESQEHTPHSSRPEPSLSPRSKIAEPAEVWQSEYNETLGFRGLKAFNDGSEPGVSSANHGYVGMGLCAVESWDYDIEEMEHYDYNTVPGYGALSPGPMDYQTDQGDGSMNVSHASLESTTRSTPYQQGIKRPTKPFKEIGAQFELGSPTDLGMSTNCMSIPLPRVVVSSVDNESMGGGKKSGVPQLYGNTLSTATQFDAKWNLGQSLHMSVASSGSNILLPDVKRNIPNDYEIATQDRQPPDTVLGCIEPQLGTLAVESVNAFHADADSTTANVAAVSNTDESFGVKRRPLPRNPSTLQIPTKTPPGSQHWQSPSGSTLPHSTFQNSIQTPMYPTPPSSFRGIAEYHQLDNIYGGDDPTSTPATPLCVTPTELSPSVSPSPSYLSDADDGVTCCSICPFRIFTGTPVAQKNSLQRHMRDNHDGKPRLECLVRGCTVSFAPGRKDNLKKHIRATHPDYPLPATSTKRKRKADSDFES